MKYQKKQRVDLEPAAKQAFSKFGFEPTEKQGRYKRFGVLYKAKDRNKLKPLRRVEPLTDCIKYHGVEYINTAAAAKILDYKIKHAAREIKRYPVRILDVDLSHSTYWRKSDIEAIKDGRLKKIDDLDFLNRCEDMKFRIRKIDNLYYYVANKGKLQITFKCDLAKEDIELIKPSERFKLYHRNNAEDLYYFIGNRGNIINVSHSYLLKQKGNKDTYINVSINGENNGAHTFIARVWISVGDPERTHLHHINRFKNDNRVFNLVRCTPMEHKHLHELYNQIEEAETIEARAAARKAYKGYIRWLREDDKNYIKVA